MINFNRTLELAGQSGMVQPVKLVQYDDAYSVGVFSLTENGQPFTIPSGATAKVRFKKPDGKGVYNDAEIVSDTVKVTFTQQMTAAFGAGFLNIELTVDGCVKCSEPLQVAVLENAVQEGQIESTDEFLTLEEILQQAQKWGQIVQQNAGNIQTVVDNLAVIKDAQKQAANAAASAAAAKDSASAAKASEANAAASAAAAAGSSSAAKASETNAASSASTASAKVSEAESSARLAEGSKIAAASSASEAAAQAGLAKDYAEQAASIAQGQKGFFSSESALKQAFPVAQVGDWAIVGSTDSMWVWDGDSSSWVDTHKTTDLSNYYTKTQSDQRYATSAQGLKADAAVPKTGDSSNTTVSFTASLNRVNILTGEKLSIIAGKLSRWLSDLKTVAFTGAYGDLSGTPASLKNPQPLTINFNGVSQVTYDGSEAKNANITPTGIGAAPSSHTHNYAGSSSAGGAANSTIKLQTARGITIGNITKQFDGSAPLTYMISEIGAEPATQSGDGYIRFDSGVQICWGIVERSNLQKKQDWGPFGIFSPIDQDIPCYFAKSFTQNPAINVLLDGNWGSVLSTWVDSAKINSVTIGGLQSDSNLTITVRYIAIGRWK